MTEEVAAALAEQDTVLMQFEAELARLESDQTKLRDRLAALGTAPDEQDFAEKIRARTARLRAAVNSIEATDPVPASQAPVVPPVADPGSESQPSNSTSESVVEEVPAPPVTEATGGPEPEAPKEDASDAAPADTSSEPVADPAPDAPSE